MTIEVCDAPKCKHGVGVENPPHGKAFLLPSDSYLESLLGSFSHAKLQARSKELTHSKMGLVSTLCPER